MKITVFFIVFLLALSAVFAQNYKIDWYSIGSGGGLVAGGAYKLNGTIGQSAAGLATSSQYLHWIGFWSGDIITPTLLDSIEQAKLLADGTFVSVPGKVAVSGSPDRFNGFFYLEEPDRSSGIRVAVGSWPIAGLTEGSVVNVIGAMGTTAAGERQVLASIVLVLSSTSPIKPLGMTNKWIGGGDFGSPADGIGQYGVIGGFGLNNIGLLVKTWGRIAYKDPSGSYILIGDGIGSAIRIDTAGLAGVPESGYVSIIGVSSLYTGRLPLVLPRRNSDVEPR